VPPNRWTVHGILLRLKRKGLRYWMTSFFVFVLTITGSPYIYDYLHLNDVRAKFFQQLLDWGPRPPEPNFTKVVLIEDDEYWSPALGGRRPIKRDYLAKLIEKLVSLQPQVIALDFDTRLPNPSSLDVPQQYKEETDALIRAIVNAAQNGRKIVLSTPISYDAAGNYQRDSDIYQAYGLCQHPNTSNTSTASEVTTKNVTCGYLALPYDSLAIPGPLLLSDGQYLDSFSLAIARMERPDLVKRLLESFGARTRYANYISFEKLKRANAVLSARSVIQGTVDNEAFQGRAVIIGANWSEFAAGRGPRIDQHRTPVGRVVGAALQANYAEAFLDSRVFRATPKWVLHVTEIIFSLIAAIAFALIISAWGKILALFSFFIIMLIVQWSMLHGFGVFFDALVPLLGLGLHSLYERLLGASEAS
jgi:CHASE2 domain-containing sensor protein